MFTVCVLCYAEYAKLFSENINYTYPSLLEITFNK